MKSILRHYYVLSGLFLFGSLGAVAQAPANISFSPTSGALGAVVTITGNNFSPVAENNLVYFGVAKAMVFAASPTSLTVKVPTGANYQPISVTVSNLTGYSNRSFSVTFPNPCPGFFPYSFSKPTTYSPDATPRNVATADFDGDGKPDVVVNNSALAKVSVFRNTGVSVTIALAPRVEFSAGNGARAVVVGDLDGDGKPDMVTANYLANTVSVFRNTSVRGTINFVRTDYQTGNFPETLAIGDFDGDGKPDIATNNLGLVTMIGSQTVSVLRNTSVPGTLAFAPRVDFPAGFSPNGLVTGDLDGDGKPDLASVNTGDGTLSIFRNTSTSGIIAFAPRINYPMGSGIGFNRFAIGDLDGDGKLELAVPNGTSISIFKNLGIPGTIAFAPRMDFPLGSQNRSLNITIGDLDGDSKPDLASVNNPITVSVLKNNSTPGTVSFGTAVNYDGDFNTDVVIVDMDEDGRPDLVATTEGNNVLTVYKNQVSCSRNCIEQGATFTYNQNSGLSYKYYEGIFKNNLPDFGALTPVATGVSSNVSLTPRKRDDNFAFLWEGTINILKAGTYFFETKSDDGSKLYIGNYGHYITPVVDNNGEHVAKFAGGSFTFPTPGTYPIAITFFEAYGAESMEVYWTSPAAGIPTRTLIPDNAFKEVNCNGVSPVQTPLVKAAIAKETVAGDLKVSAAPNPSSSYFTLNIGSNSSKEKVTIRVMDMIGRVIETRTVSAGTSVQLGAAYHRGTYLAQVVQANNTVTVKLVKQ